MDVTLVTVEGSKHPQSLRLRSEEAIVGRREGCDVRIPSHSVSRRHCRLSFREDLLTVEDLASSNGTFVNGHVTFLVQYTLTPSAEAKLAELRSSSPVDEEAVEPIFEGVELEDEPTPADLADTELVMPTAGKDEQNPDASELLRNWDGPTGGDLRDILEQLGDGKEE
jgi:hypothetical protein